MHRRLDEVGWDCRHILALLQEAADAKPEGHELLAQHYRESRRMAQIGG
jgi:hypothetical protein